VLNEAASCALSACRNAKNEATVPFLFWLPMILLSGLFSVAEDTRTERRDH
jgi:hypothetical protein